MNNFQRQALGAAYSEAAFWGRMRDLEAQGKVSIVDDEVTILDDAVADEVLEALLDAAIVRQVGP